MPNFDGTGLLKRGRIIGRGLKPRKKCDDAFESRIKPAGLAVMEGTNPE